MVNKHYGAETAQYGLDIVFNNTSSFKVYFYLFGVFLSQSTTIFRFPSI